ncbi:MAG: class I SAM-dependent RNA methyltransferase [Eubacteriales bacterium]|nr:class I SAM-dependent RNA methyltransferase [Eubacteriales bacterium]
MSLLKEVNDCKLNGICGGCAYAGGSYEAQLNEKNEHIRNLLNDACREMPEYEGIIESPIVFGYRNKMEYSFGDEKKDGPLTLGLHKKRSFYDVIDVDCCKLVHEDFNQIVKVTKAYFDDLGLTYKDKRSHLGFLRHLIIRRAVNTGEMLIDLVTTSQPLLPVMAHNLINNVTLYDKDKFDQGILEASDAVNVYGMNEIMNEWKDLILELKKKGLIEGEIKGILHTVNDSKADAVKNEGTTVLYGEDSICEELIGLKFQITPFSFFQTNSKGAEVLYTKAREYVSQSLSKDATVYDLYSGTGTIAQMLAPCVSKVIGVEIIPEAVEAAKENAKRNNLDNCSFIAGDVLKILDTIEDKPDVIILDPPRDGVNPKALSKIIQYGVETIVYISCKAESLCRDLIPLQAAGYKPIKACAVDQFPWTKNVETICLLNKEK